MDSEDPSTPETERAGDSDAVLVEDELDGEIANDAPDGGANDENPVKLEFNMENSEESATTINDKPPTPMPE